MKRLDPARALARTHRRKRDRKFPTGPSPKKRRRLKRFRKRHRLAHLPKVKWRGPRAAHYKQDSPLRDRVPDGRDVAKNA